ncbi:MAG: hypothetical protein ABH835_03165 [Patescibacteria group bacterium]
MNKTKKSIVVFTLVSAVTLSGMTMATASQAAEFEWGQGFFQKVWERLSDDDKAELEKEKESFMQERQGHREEMNEIIATGDYAQWKEQIEARPKITDVITEENFDKFKEMHQLMQDGNFEEAQIIREELGLPDRGHGIGRGMGMALWK